MNRILLIVILLAALVSLSSCTEQVTATPAPAQNEKAQQIARGRYLVGFGGCNDCHTPLKMGANGPEPDMSRMLSGHPQDLVMPKTPQPQGPWMWTGSATMTAFSGPWGVSYARNLTPDQVSGLGIWTEDMFIKTMRTGRHMGVSRPLLPPMPWQSLNHLSDDDLKAVFAYLRSIPPVRNEVPDPVIAPPPPAPSAAS